jgi:hypothetical protein
MASLIENIMINHQTCWETYVGLNQVRLKMGDTPLNGKFSKKMMNDHLLRVSKYGMYIYISLYSLYINACQCMVG